MTVRNAQAVVLRRQKIAATVHAMHVLSQHVNDTVKLKQRALYLNFVNNPAH